MSLHVRELHVDDFSAYQAAVGALEHGVTYPLGSDRFTIDHGADYFAFFRRLGELSYFVALDGARVVAVCAAVLRHLPRAPGAAPEATWYLGDLKVHPDYRTQRIPWRMFLHGFPGKYARCQRGYAISMNPGDGSPNPVVRLATHFHLAPASVATTLGLYSLSAEAMREVAPLLERERGPLGYLSLGGVKDIVLESTHAPMALLHVQFGPARQQHGAVHGAPVADHVHMFCLPAGDPLEDALRTRGITAGAAASVIHHRMAGWDWRFVLTSDI